MSAAFSGLEKMQQSLSGLGSMNSLNNIFSILDSLKLYQKEINDANLA